MHRSGRVPDLAQFGGACRGKRPFASKRQAAGAQRLMRRRYPGTTATLEPYKCRACGHWHNGRRGRLAAG